MKQKIVQLATLIFFAALPLQAGDEIRFELSSPECEERAVTVNFQDVSMLEFLRFVSAISEKNFIYDEKLLDFNISLVTGRATSPEKILEIMVELLGKQGIKAEEKEGYFLVEKMDEWELKDRKMRRIANRKGLEENKEGLRLVNDFRKTQLIPFHEFQKRGDFFVYKLQYHVGTEILSAIKNVAATLKHNPGGPKDLVQSIDSMQWVQSTNSILYTGTEEGIGELTELIQSLDVPKKQVFIEVLVIETDVKKGLEFGLEWAAGGQYRDKFGYGMGNFPGSHKKAPFASTFQDINADNPPTGSDQFPLGRGFDLGVIGDIILHKGKSYLSLGSLVSALQADGDTTIVLNQKIITQDNKLSRIFVGDNIAFTGSTVETIGASQQTSANIEYRDVGVKLNITPLLGNGDIITLEISEEITNVIPNLHSVASTANGINTTKTDMATQVHVPDQSFLVLSGMIRNSKRHHKSGIPCLGGLPVVGAAFSKSTEQEEKRNVIVFVRPQIIHSGSEYQSVTAFQENQFRNQAPSPANFEQGIDMVKREKTYDFKRDKSEQKAAGRDDHSRT